ncbi:MAG: DMT family transporter [Anaerolineae bacterium]
MTPPRSHSHSVDAAGVALIITSAAGFATLAIFGKLAFASGMTLPTMLTLRFTGAAAIFWAMLSATGAAAAWLGRRKVAQLLLMGGLGYAGQSTLYMISVSLLPAAVVGMLLYTYPMWVTLLAWWLHGDKPDGRRWVALGLALAGTTLIAGAPEGQINPLGILTALLAGLWYAGYIVLGNRIIKGVAPLVSSAWILLGAAISFGAAGLILGQIQFTFASPQGWLVVGGMILMSTVIPVVTFLAGLQRVGPTQSALLSALEPVFTVALAVAFLGEHLAPLQIAGSVLVITAVILLQWRR